MISKKKIQNPVIELHYLPNIFYCSLLTQSPFFYIEAQETFNKRSFRNKTFILGPNKILRLTVPIKHGTKYYMINTLEIDYAQPWFIKHWHAIEYAYKKAPYFDFIAPYFKDIFFEKKKYLFDLNLSFLTLIFELLELPLSFELTKHYEKIPQYSIDWRERIHPKKIIEATTIPYQQLFGDAFIPNLSILDLLFLKGQESIEYLRKTDISKLNLKILKKII